MKATLFVVCLSMACVGCESGLPKEFQPMDVRAVVKVCHQNGGTSRTVFNKPDDYISVMCRLPLSRPEGTR